MKKKNMLKAIQLIHQSVSELKSEPLSEPAPFGEGAFRVLSTDGSDPANLHGSIGGQVNDAVGLISLANGALIVIQGSAAAYAKAASNRYSTEKLSPTELISVLGTANPVFSAFSTMVMDGFQRRMIDVLGFIVSDAVDSLSSSDLGVEEVELAQPSSEIVFGFQGVQKLAVTMESPLDPEGEPGSAPEPEKDLEPGIEPELGPEIEVPASVD